MHLYLHLTNSSAEVEDEEGQDFAALDEAVSVAIAGIRGYLADEVRDTGLCDLNGAVRITDEAQCLLREIPFTEAVTIVRSGPDRS